MKVAYGRRRWSPRRLLLHIMQLPAESRTMRALTGAVAGMNLDQQLLVSISHKLDTWTWLYQVMQSDPNSKDRDSARAAREVREQRPEPPAVTRLPAWLDDNGRLRSVEEMARLRAEAKEARERETSDNEPEKKATGTAEDFAQLMSGG